MSQRPGLFGGIAVLSCGTVVLQIALTRLYSALFGHHLAFLAISLSLFGAGTGGVLLYVFPGIARPPRVLARLAYLACIAAATTVCALLVAIQTKPLETLDGASIGRLAALYLASSLPFVATGIAIAAALRHAAADVSRLYLVDLVGAALGGPLAIAALQVGAPRAVLLVALIDCTAALVFYGAARHGAAVLPGLETRASGSVVAAFSLAAAVLLAGDLSAPWLKLPVHGLGALPDRVEFEAWNEMALVTVDKPIATAASMRLDGGAATPIFDGKATPPVEPDDLAYVLHKEHGPVLIIGAGGGRELRAALKNGQKAVYAAEVNPVVAGAVMRDKYKAFSGDLYDKAEVHVTIADGRSYVRSSALRFRNIVVSQVDSSAATGGSALALVESSLYTVEAFEDDLAHLDPSGTLVVTRSDTEFDRLLSLGATALRAAGLGNPAQHMFACGSAKSTTLLIKRQPLLPAETTLLRTSCKKNKFSEAFSPDDPHGDLRRRLASAVDTGAAVSNPRLDLRAPTDDRPFFFYTVPPRHLLAALRNLPGLETENPGLLTLFGLLTVSVGLAVVFLLGPLLVVRRPAAPPGSATPPRLRPLVFFASLGAGFVFVEVALVQHFVLFLGHPVYALSTVLSALLVWAGLGSWLTGRVSVPWAALRAGRRAQLLVAVLAVYAAALGPVLGQLVSLPLGVRIGLTLGILAPLGLLMGSQAPLGVKLVAARSPEMIPWCWGLNGVASVIATAAGTLIAMHLGFSAVLLAGGGSYLLAAAVVPAAE